MDVNGPAHEGAENSRSIPAGLPLTVTVAPKLANPVLAGAYQRILDEGHAVGNHTYNHVNGWKASNDHYLKNIQRAAKYIKSNAFRPPYGRIKFSQVRKLRENNPDWKIYMWDILSGDFDQTITPEQCLANVLVNIVPGSIVIFHDSTKAWERMSYALPRVLEHCRQQGWKMKVLPT